VVRPVERRYERKRVGKGTLGAAFRERRWSRGLEQRQAAEEIGVALATYRNWEVNRKVPDLRLIPRAIRFLGYDWRQVPDDFGGKIWHARTAEGLCLPELAAKLGISPDTLLAWEANEHRPSPTLLKRVEGWLASGRSKVG
jgi:transcriptional regulator with XRE-family HTH domain